MLSATQHRSMQNYSHYLNNHQTNVNAPQEYSYPPAGGGGGGGGGSNGGAETITSYPGLPLARTSHGVTSGAAAARDMMQQEGSGVPAQAPSPSHTHLHVQQHDPHYQHSLPHAPPSKFPMAAPPLPNTPTFAANSAIASPKSPQSPGNHNREQQRINLLFEINVELLQEVNRLQAEGYGGAISPQMAMQLRNDGKADKMASDDYIQCLRRVQANLSYLMPRAQPEANNSGKPIPIGPAHMTPPPHMPQLQPKYDQLREIFPGWGGVNHQRSQSSSSPHNIAPSTTNGTAAPPQA